LRDMFYPHREHLAPAFRDLPLTPRTPFQTATVFELLNGSAASAGFENLFSSAFAEIPKLVCLEPSVQGLPDRLVVQVMRFEQFELLALTFIFEDGAGADYLTCRGVIHLPAGIRFIRRTV